MWRRYCCLTSFFPIVDICLRCEDIARQICAMARKWRIFGDFLRAVFSASRMQHVSDLHSKFALRLQRVWKYGRHPLCDGWDKASKKEKKIEEATGQNIMSATQGGHNQLTEPATRVLDTTMAINCRGALQSLVHRDTATPAIMWRAAPGEQLPASCNCPWAIMLTSKTLKTRIWANAQRDGRPAECRWRPLFNAAKFG